MRNGTWFGRNPNNRRQYGFMINEMGKYFCCCIRNSPVSYIQIYFSICWKGKLWRFSEFIKI